jgi:hypothetical protein
MPKLDWRALYGFSLLAILTILVALIALGTVTEQTSFGLMPLIVALSNLATTFANWAFSIQRSDATILQASNKSVSSSSSGTGEGAGGPAKPDLTQGRG